MIFGCVLLIQLINSGLFGMATDDKRLLIRYKACTFYGHRRRRTAVFTERSEEYKYRCSTYYEKVAAYMTDDQNRRQRF